ncbi:hypothetical protein [Marinitenerispora sediminis]|uniref:Uncharacterized protein n=1 Tax=Marinitenerispora sediminis TaxID=1931232 RepID=A0A368T7A6_9ACTN|nr:hypothetical protein [Marinitenerispora sediminis]RCV54660.1 hypothetical protein DEF23_15510 [Marinitenerispora sediminis]RCV56435.1 hypothetical protein DEF28_03585 [Marinitenerispora sediminis]RCV59756.1 hypothetical protein DEF24_08910 [Marinitenerispora sediminis]
MPVYVCSLAGAIAQAVPPGGGYHLLRFPFDSSGEAYDVHRMHDPVQPDGHVVEDWRTDPRSGLIWPRVNGWGQLHANIHWRAGDYGELRDRFCRDPLDLSTGVDSTGTDHRPPSPGMQCFTKSHGIFVRPGTPLGLMVGHTATAAATVEYAQFKLVIHADVAAAAT